MAATAAAAIKRNEVDQPHLVSPGMVPPPVLREHHQQRAERWPRINSNHTSPVFCGLHSKCQTTAEGAGAGAFGTGGGEAAAAEPLTDEMAEEAVNIKGLATGGCEQQGAVNIGGLTTGDESAEEDKVVGLVLEDEDDDEKKLLPAATPVRGGGGGGSGSNSSSSD